LTERNCNFRPTENGAGPFGRTPLSKYSFGGIFMKNDKAYLFAEAPINKAIASFSVPMIIAMVVSIVYNLVDTFYIGLMKDYNLMAAVSLALPISTVFMGVGNIFGVGGGTYISRLLGKKDEKRIKNVSSFIFYMPIAIGVILTVLGFVGIEPILKILGTSPDTIAPTRQYAMVMILGGVATILSFSLSQIIRAEGAAKESMYGNIIGTFINLVFDPIFLFAFGWGITGIAVATIMSQVIVSLYYMAYILRKSSMLSLKLTDFSMHKTMVSEVLKIGFPAFLQNIVMIFSNLVQNNLAAHLGDVYVAVFGIIFKLSMIPKQLSRGLCQGIQPLIGYNYAAKNYERAKGILKKTLTYCSVLCIAFLAIIFLGSAPLLDVFSHNAEVVTLGTPLFHIATVSFLTYGVAFLTTNLFQSTGKAAPAFIMSLAQGVIYIPVVILASQLAGVIGFAWALPIADIITAGLGAVVYIICRQKIWRPQIG
jgi:multidrug efflux pump